MSRGSEGKKGKKKGGRNRTDARAVILGDEWRRDTDLSRMLKKVRSPPKRLAEVHGVYRRGTGLAVEAGRM